MKRLLLLILCGLAPVVAMASPPAPYTAHYQVLRNGTRLGVATISFRPLANGRYELRTDTQGSEGLAAIAGVSINERSIIRWNGSMPETVAYSFRQKMAWKSKDKGFQVDASNGRIDSQDKDRHFSPPYQPGVLDRNAITVALMADLASGKTGELRYLVPDHDVLQTQVFHAGASTRLDTALGPQRTVRVDRVRESGDGRTTSFWLAQDRNYLPVRIMQREPNGETIEMRISSSR